MRLTSICAVLLATAALLGADEPALAGSNASFTRQLTSGGSDPIGIDVKGPSGVMSVPVLQINKTTGAVTVSPSALPTAAITGGTIDGATLGATTPIGPITGAGLASFNIAGPITTDGYQQFGIKNNLTNTGAFPGYGDRTACFTSASKIGFELCRSALMFDTTTASDFEAHKSIGSIALTAGTGYAAGTYPLVFSGGSPTTGNTAVGTYTVSGGGVTSYAITNAGDYASAPRVSFPSGGGSGASGTIAMSVGGIGFQTMWFIHVSPRDTTHQWQAVVAEGNPVNRANDPGLIYDLFTTGHTQIVGGFRMVPESHTFGQPVEQETFPVSFDYACARSGTTNTSGAFAGQYSKSYLCLNEENDSIAPGGVGIHLGGDLLGVPANYPLAPLVADGTWTSGIHLEAATLINGVALSMASGQTLTWSNGAADTQIKGACSGSTCNMVMALPRGALIPYPTGVNFGSSGARWGQVFATTYIESLTTPASSSAACTAGQFTDDANYHYVCTATNTWKRIALSAF